MANKILEFFQLNGKKIEGPANTRLSLQKEGTIWFVEEGSLILFGVQKLDKEEEGRRTFLSTVREGSLCFNVPNLDYIAYEVFAFSESPFIVWELSADRLNKHIMASPEEQKVLAPLLERWVHRFEDFLFYPGDTKADHLIVSQTSLDLEDQEVFSVKRSEYIEEKEKVQWAYSTEDTFKLIYPYDIKLPSLIDGFPLIPHLYFQSEKKSTLKLVQTTEMVASGKWLKALSPFHTFILQFLASKRSRLERKELRNFEEKEEQQAVTLHHTLHGMLELLNEAKEEEVIHHDPLIEACQKIGKQLKIPLTVPQKKRFKDSIKERLELIANESGVRVREMELASEWWKNDSGPLLAFYGRDKLPVAITQDYWGRYIYKDPVKGKVARVTAETKHHFSSQVFGFYQGIPEEVQSGKEACKLYFKRNKHDYLKLALYSAFAAILALFPPVGIAFIFNQAIPNSNLQMLLQITLGLVVSGLSASLFLYFRALITGRIEGIASSQIQSALWDRLLRLPPNFFRKFSAGNLFLRVMAMTQIRTFFTSNGVRQLITGIFAFFYLIVMLAYSIKLTLLALLLTTLSSAVTVICSRLKIKSEKANYELQGKISGELVQILSGVAKLRVAGAENNAFSYWASLYKESKKYEMHSQNIQNIVTTLLAAFPLFSILAIFALVIRLEEGSGLSIGAFLAFNTAYMTFSVAVFDLSNTILQSVSIIPIFQRSKVIIEETQEVLVKKSHPGKLSGEIRLDKISFQYEEKGAQILKEVSIQVHPREFIAILGPSGSGKSTLFRLLLGFEHPSAGAVYFNGKDLSHLNINEVRKQMGVVLQGGGIIAGTLYQNLVCGGRYTEEAINRAITLSAFKNDLRHFPMGLHTVVPMNGETLSGGQKQRLLIARALLPNPNILLLDEATSALDNKSQEEITHNIDRLDITRIVIAHRLSTIKNADRIYVLNEGQVVQSGSFDELSTKEGLFAQMLNRQKL